MKSEEALRTACLVPFSLSLCGTRHNITFIAVLAVIFTLHVPLPSLCSTLASPNQLVLTPFPPTPSFIPPCYSSSSFSLLHAPPFPYFLLFFLACCCMAWMAAALARMSSRHAASLSWRGREEREGRRKVEGEMRGMVHGQRGHPRALFLPAGGASKGS